MNQAMTITQQRDHRGLDQEGDGSCEVGWLYISEEELMGFADGFNMKYEKRSQLT